MIEAILRRGILVTVVVAMVLFFGIMAALRVPIQMIPDLDVRVISIETRWPGATPQDVEKEIVIEQEEYLRSLPSLKRMISQASTGEATIELEFPFGTDINEALIRVNNALSQVPAYPENVDEPVLYTNSFSANAFMSFRVVPLPGNPHALDIDMMRDFVDDHVRPYLERVPGISQVDVGGGAERQVQILVDAARLAERGLTLTALRDAVRQRNLDVSAGDVDSGKRRYLLRTVGRFDTLAELEDLILQRNGDAITRLRDVATVRLDHFEIRNRSYTNGEANIRLSLYRESGSNVIAIKRALEPVVQEVNRDILHAAGLEMALSNDDVRYVESAVTNVWQNLAIGGLLASVVMFLFLRSFTTTLVGICGIPICTIASFIALLMAGRTLNVISLAGIAFAIGMSVDNTIVVLESIERHRRRGLNRFAAALAGTREVWAATLASTLTTILVFLPVLFVQEEAGQLFSDIAIAISASIFFSMLVAVAVVPVACAHLPRRAQSADGKDHTPLKVPILGAVHWLTGGPARRLACIMVFITATASAVYFLTPPAEYLPEGEEAKAFSSMIAPPGYSIEEMHRIGLQLQDDMLPALEQNPEDFDAGRTTVPALARFTLIVQPESLRVIAETKNPAHIDRWMEVINERFRAHPGMRAFSSRGSIISSNDGGTRSVNVDVSGPNLPEIYQAAQTIFRKAQEVLERPQINSDPSSLTLGQPLLELRPRWERLTEMGLSAEEFGYAVSALSDGAFVDEFFLDDDKVDIFLYSKAASAQKLDRLTDFSLYTPHGTVVPVSAMADLHETVDTADIRRVDGRRTVTLRIIPPRSTPLETAVAMVRSDVINRLKADGSVPASVSMSLSGASDQLEATKEALGVNFIIAVVLCYLLLVVVYKHWGYPWIIMTTVPMGIAGGITGLWLLNWVGALLPGWGLTAIRQPFDMITMLGFLILVGTVVNNPILIVDRALQNFHIEKLSPLESVREAMDVRIRPILISTITTLCGLAPLVFIPGAGTELYRGLGAIVLFGLAFSTIVTLTYLPSLLESVLALVARFRRTTEAPEVG